MPWTDRIQTPAYISPSGTRFEFQYEDVNMESNKKSGEFVFPEIEGVFIQDLGRSGRKFPFIIYFSGSDYDTQSDAFVDALEETGIGTLEHPKYGTRKVVPTGTIARRDDLLTASNQSVITVTFSETIININFPSSSINEKTDIKNSVNDFNSTTSDQFAETLDIESESESVLLQNDLVEIKDLINSTLEDLITINEEIKTTMDILSDSFDTTVLDLLLNPGGVADQLITIINTPSNIATSAQAMIEGYGSVIDTVLGGFVNSINNYRSSKMVVSSTFGALSLSMLNAEFTNRPQAVDAANRIIYIHDSIGAWIDTNITEFSIQDTDEDYEKLNEIYSKIIGYLIRLSFDLPKEIFINLTEDRQLIELVAELYGDIDMIDFFIQTNELTIDEIEILPLGKQVVYYE